MAYPIIQTCPICEHSLHVSKLTCTHCHTVIENDFVLSRFAAFSVEQMEFIEVFLLKRGNIKEVEKALGISYPTVRGKLNEIVALLGHQEESTDETKRKSDIISLLDNNEITPQEAIELLKKDNKGSGD